MIHHAGGESQAHYGAAANMASSCSIESGAADLDQTERVDMISSQLGAGRCLTRSALLAEVEVSPATLTHELVMDILRHVPEVAVIAPAGLREVVREKLRAELARITP